MSPQDGPSLDVELSMKPTLDCMDNDWIWWFASDVTRKLSRITFQQPEAAGLKVYGPYTQKTRLIQLYMDVARQLCVCVCQVKLSVAEHHEQRDLLISHGATFATHHLCESSIVKTSLRNSVCTCSLGSGTPKTPLLPELVSEPEDEPLSPLLLSPARSAAAVRNAA